MKYSVYWKSAMVLSYRYYRK